jgi:hypothetical protein
MSNTMHMDSDHSSPATPSVEADQANTRLAVKLVMLVVVIFLITLWKFRPV